MTYIPNQKDLRQLDRARQIAEEAGDHRTADAIAILMERLRHEAAS